MRRTRPGRRFEFYMWVFEGEPPSHPFEMESKPVEEDEADDGADDGALLEESTDEALTDWEFSEDGRHLVASGYSDYQELWDADSRTRLLRFKRDKRLSSYGFVPERHLFYFADEIALTGPRQFPSASTRVFDLMARRRLGTLGGWPVAATNDWSRVLIADTASALHIWDARSFERLCEIPEEAVVRMEVDFFDGGRRLFVGYEDGRASVYRRRRPERWWGVFCLYELWATAAFAGLFLWSVWRDRRALKVAADE